MVLQDFEDAREVVAACLTYCTAQDVAAAQLRYGQMRQSALTAELERVKQRLDGLMGDYLFARYQDEKRAAGEEVPDLEEDEEFEEELSSEPLGRFEVPRRKTRRLDLSEDTGIAPFDEEDDLEDE